MYQQIKRLADEALALQNKDRMDAALREISALCGDWRTMSQMESYAPGLDAMKAMNAVGLPVVKFAEHAKKGGKK